MSLENFQFNIFKSPDRVISNGLKDAFQKAGFELSAIQLHPALGGAAIRAPITNFESNQEIKQIFDFNSELFSQFSATISGPEKKFSTAVTVFRNTNGVDSCSVQAHGIDEQYRAHINSLVANLRANLKALDSTNTQEAILGSVLSAHYQARESELSKLLGISETVISDQEKYRQTLEKTYDAKKSGLERDYADLKKALDNKEAEFNQRLTEIDDRAARHARRELRESLKETFQQRGKKFALSDGTIALRSPVNNLAVALIAVFGGLFILAVLNSFGIVGTQSQDATWIHNVRQAVLGFGFAASIVFFIRWNSRWFERHAREEFLLKRQEIDVDRASWAVELAFEWFDEKKCEISEALLRTITRNLFDYEPQPAAVLHPLDELASAILGSAASARVKVNGTELEFDRKSKNHLSKPITSG
ncbi:MAG TPA: hypothetical protein DCS07_01340 [Bdellovibrionales bacterium]|nr:MAG: hypothetical protein A2Z97_04195 [Bdellovibrionales bacterium GWB1_52_6]OFZ02436.1 MAG: hypothetical protein A2X97_12870 [Bdellovibrionales bacterium GWA1_52_35]OFZ39323.1 MAG: hypothetical protein A2070_00650 [Bdellovibrionales bacterium GWC1_52_8]HAR41270.1 hypothetical protein [Bdellovibrionales bacterium]HCM41536.1 hypothetical protein [Bdellovibrionales bacterium]